MRGQGAAAPDPLSDHGPLGDLSMVIEAEQDSVAAGHYTARDGRNNPAHHRLRQVTPPPHPPDFGIRRRVAACAIGTPAVGVGCCRTR